MNRESYCDQKILTTMAVIWIYISFFGHLSDISFHVHDLIMRFLISEIQTRDLYFFSVKHEQITFHYRFRSATYLWIMNFIVT